MTTCIGNSIFHLETIVPCLKLTDPDQVHNACPVCVCFRFDDLAEMEICEGDFCDIDRSLGGGEIRMTRGVSCLFVIDSSDLCRTARNFCAKISVYRRVAGGPETRLVAQTMLEFDRKFTDIILDPDQPDKKRQVKRVLSLYQSGRPKPVGTIEVIVRLTSHGDLLMTQFRRDAISNKYQYQGLDEYVPTNAKVSENCLDKNHCLKKCCQHSCASRRKIKLPAKEEKDRIDFDKQLDQVNCILNIMEMMKDLFTKAISSTTTRDINNQDDTDKGQKMCMFDPNCPVVGCPFKIGEPITQFVDQMIKGPDSTVVTNDFNNSLNEIVDDADLFIINVGRVDPCRYHVPVYRNKKTQYLDTDIPIENLPPPEPVKSKSKTKSKPKSKKRKKNKKEKK